MTPSLHELCSEIVEDCHGEFYGLLFRQLTNNGRLTANQLAQKCHLPLRQIRAGLAALSQLRLVYHHQVHFDDIANYSANLDMAYDLIRVGRLTNLVLQKLGRCAERIMNIACDLTFSTISELEGRVLDDLTDQDRLIWNQNHISRSIKKLLDHRFLIYVRTSEFVCPHDLKRKVEHSLSTTGIGTKPSGPKARAELEIRAKKELESTLSTAIPEHGFLRTEKINYTNEPKSSTSPAFRSEHLHVNGHNDSSSVLIRPNFGKVVSEIRCTYLSDQVQRRFGDIPSKTLKTVIIQTEPDEQASTDDVVVYNIDITKVQSKISENHESAIENAHSHANSNGFLHNEDTNITARNIERSLQMLEEGSLRFLQRDEPTDRWILDRVVLRTYIRQVELLRLMGSNIGDLGPRILRMLIERGKMEEKTLQEIGLVGAKELRQTLSELKQMGYVDLQEVPRETQRQPNRTIYLWFHDEERVRSTVIDAIFVSMTRLLQRLKLERRKILGTLDKIERADVEGNEQNMMAGAEYDHLQRFRKLEQWIIGEICRLDTSIAVLRDL